MIRKLILSAMLMGIAVWGWSQNPANNTYEVFDLSSLPEYPGGEAKLMEFLMENLKYPAVARENNIQGTVIVRFVIDTTGQTTQIQVAKSIGGGCDEEAMRVIRKMAAWKPGMKDQRKVKVLYHLPIRFQLTDDMVTEEIVQYKDLTEKPVSKIGDLKTTAKFIRKSVELTKAEKKSLKGKNISVVFALKSDGTFDFCYLIGTTNKAISDKFCKAISNLGNWTPGQKNGKPVRSQLDFDL